MPFSIQLRFDKDSEQKILNLSGLLDDLGLINPQKSHGSLPHIATSVFRDCDPDTLVSLSRAVAQRPFDVLLNSIGTFPTGENVIFLGLADCGVLSRFHLDLYSLVAPVFSYEKYYEPGQWFPHCTIGIDFTDDEFIRAFSFLKRRFVPLTCRVERLVITKFRPSEVVFERMLE